MDTSPLRSLPKSTKIHGIVVAKERAHEVEISKPAESSFGAAAKDVKITTTIDTLVKGMLIFSCTWLTVSSTTLTPFSFYLDHSD